MRILTALAALAALTLCCTHRDPVEETVGKLRSSAENRDAGGIASLLAPDFVSQDEKKDDVVASLRGYFLAYRNLDVVISDLKIARTDDTGSADLLAEISGSPRQAGGLDQILPSRTKLHIHLTLRRDGSKWLVDSAGWDRID